MDQDIRIVLSNNGLATCQVIDKQDTLSDSKDCRYYLASQRLSLKLFWDEVNRRKSTI